jgi:site-specific DNA recombinase
MMQEKPLCRAALYARVSSDQQAEAGTIESQVAALQEQIRKDGLGVDPELCFIDDGYSGSTLVRPALERLRVSVAKIIDGKSAIPERGR